MLACVAIAAFGSVTEAPCTAAAEVRCPLVRRVWESAISHHLMAVECRSVVLGHTAVCIWRCRSKHWGGITGASGLQGIVKRAVEAVKQ